MLQYNSIKIIIILICILMIRYSLYLLPLVQCYNLSLCGLSMYFSLFFELVLFKTMWVFSIKKSCYSSQIWKIHSKFPLGMSLMPLLCLSVNRYQSLVLFTYSISVTFEHSYQGIAQKKRSIKQNRLYHTQICKLSHTSTSISSSSTSSHSSGILKEANAMDSLDVVV